MLRFIFVCMGVVALSFIAIGAQYMMDGVSGEADSVMARNAQPSGDTQAVAMDETSPEALNAIETTAGTPSFDPNDKFSEGFTNKAPKALADQIETPAPIAPETEEQTN